MYTIHIRIYGLFSSLPTTREPALITLLEEATFYSTWSCSLVHTSALLFTHSVHICYTTTVPGTVLSWNCQPSIWNVELSGSCQMKAVIPAEERVSIKAGGRTSLVRSGLNEGQGKESGMGWESTLHILVHLTSTATLWGSTIHICFTEREIETQSN